MARNATVVLPPPPTATPSRSAIRSSGCAPSSSVSKPWACPHDPPLDRRTGVGRVDATAGNYSDALAKGNLVHLLATESTGALSPAVILLLKELAKATQGTDGVDSTVYGLGRASPQSFFPHHLAAISSSIVRADALSIRNHAASLAFLLSHGII